MSGPLRRLERLDTGGRRTRPGGGRMIPMMRDWLVETIPAQVADLRGVLSRWPADVDRHRPLDVGADRGALGGRADPGGDRLDADGPADPRAPGPAVRLRPAGAPLGAGEARLVDASPAWRSSPRAASGGPWTTFAPPTACGPLGESVNRFSARVPLYLVGNIRELDYDRRDLPASVHYVGNFSFYPRRDEPSALLDSIPTERPWVHVTESTLAHGDPFLLRAAVEGLGGEPVELIITTGRAARGAGARLGRRCPPNVHVDATGSATTSCCRAARRSSTSAAKATILAAAEAGVPMVVVPTTWDKPDNARRVVEAGAGLRLSPRRATAPSGCARRCTSCSPIPPTARPPGAWRRSSRPPPGRPGRRSCSSATRASSRARRRRCPPEGCGERRTSTAPPSAPADPFAGGYGATRPAGRGCSPTRAAGVAPGAGCRPTRCACSTSAAPGATGRPRSPHPARMGGWWWAWSATPSCSSRPASGSGG